MEDAILPGLCPVCHHEVSGLLPIHLQSHSKQDLIYAIISQQDVLSVTPIKSKASPRPLHGTVSPIEHRSRRPSSPSKRTTRSRVSPNRKQCESNSRMGLIPKSSSSATIKSATDAPLQPLLLELETNEFGSTEPETTEIMPVPVSSYVDPEAEDGPNISNPQFQTLYSINPEEQGTESTSTSHSNFIQYILETATAGTVSGNQSLAEWVLPNGRSIPVYSTLAPVVSSVTPPLDPLSIDNENETPPVNANSLPSVDFDLMTDEEIPPRGEISEYEESNTSSHQSDELNKPGAMNIGSTLGSLFTNVRQLPPLIESEDNSEDKESKEKSSNLAQSQDQKCLELRQLRGTRIEVVSVMSSSCSSSSVAPSQSKPNVKAKKVNRAKTTKIKSTTTGSGGAMKDRHKCPETNCSQVGSIFELAKHQETVHQRKYSKVIKSEFPSQESEGIVDQKPVLTKCGKIRKIRKVKKIRKRKNNAFQCSYCVFYSDKLKLLQEHLDELHPGKPLKPRDYECETCGKMFQKKVNLKKHALIHGVKKFQCECGKGFTSGFKLMEHNRVHTKEYPFECLTCHRFFRTPSLLKAHLARTHPLPGEPIPIAPKKLEFFCSICSRVLRSKRSYLKHLELHNETSQKCPICYETFSRNATLTRHIRIAHDSSYETKESKDCPVCSKKMHPNSLKSHMRIHDNVKPFSCRICCKSFRTSANLTSHSWSHTNAEKPYKCQSCPKSYLFKKCLEAHLIVHKTRRFHFVCNECGMKFTSKVNLKRHCQEHFSEKKYKCSLCPKKFHRKYYLVEHERVHSGTKPFHCTICGKLSTTRSNHRAHIKIHDARESGTQEG